MNSKKTMLWAGIFAMFMRLISSTFPLNQNVWTDNIRGPGNIWTDNIRGPGNNILTETRANDTILRLNV
jgi:hypothetical protein